VPLALAKRAPAGFVGPDDHWTINQRFQLWTLHEWLFEYNPASVFAAYNARVH
jgi:2-methylcitrate dehydratase PrpD